MPDVGTGRTAARCSADRVVGVVARDRLGAAERPLELREGGLAVDVHAAARGLCLVVEGAVGPHVDEEVGAAQHLLDDRTRLAVVVAARVDEAPAVAQPEPREQRAQRRRAVGAVVRHRVGRRIEARTG
jgi:hypothetical protein